MVTIDAAGLEVARHRFMAVAEEMGLVLRRSAYSPNIKERMDCSAAVFTPEGETLAQAEHIPVHLGSMPASVAACIDAFGTSVEEGQQFAVNDPFHGGTHLNDLTLVRPVFVEGSLIGWVANRAHHADVGGEAPGSMPAWATRIDQEGHIVAPTLAMEGGRWLPAFVEPFVEASRTSDERAGDLAAQLGANEWGARRLGEAVRADQTPPDALGQALLDHGEARMIAALRALGEGSAAFRDVLEVGDEDVAIEARVEVADGRMIVDLRASDDQVAANVNAVRAVAVSAVSYAVRVAADPTVPVNGGSQRPVTVITRPGSVVDAVAPAAVAAGNVEASTRIADTVLGALAQLAPDRVPAASQGTMNNILIGDGEAVYYETVAGGEGGYPWRCGQSGIHTGMTNTKNTPIEALEAHYPFRVTETRLRRDSGGEGRHPGGEGIVRELELLRPATVSLIGDRRRNAPWGLAGGGSGGVGEDWVIKRGGGRERVPGKTTLDLDAGDRIRVMTPGGGGWGLSA